MSTKSKDTVEKEVPVHIDWGFAPASAKAEPARGAGAQKLFDLIWDGRDLEAMELLSSQPQRATQYFGQYPGHGAAVAEIAAQHCCFQTAKLCIELSPQAASMRSNSGWDPFLGAALGVGVLSSHRLLDRIAKEKGAGHVESERVAFLDWFLSDPSRLAQASGSFDIRVLCSKARHASVVKLAGRLLLASPDSWLGALSEGQVVELERQAKDVCGSGPDRISLHNLSASLPRMILDMGWFEQEAAPVLHSCLLLGVKEGRGLDAKEIGVVKGLAKRKGGEFAIAAVSVGEAQILMGASKSRKAAASNSRRMSL